MIDVKCFSLLLLFVSILAAACATSPVAPAADRDAAPAPQLADWAGVWVEQWPDSDQEDRFRVQLIDDGLTIQVAPLTNADQQVLANVRWDGRLLEFTNYIENRPLHYRLRLVTPDEIAGVIRSAEGKANEIRWVREDSPAYRAAAAGTGQTIAASRPADLDDWAGNWEEQWPRRDEHDVYRIQLSPERRLALDSLSNVEEQRLDRLNWNGDCLTFRVHFKGQILSYEMMQAGPDILVGIVTMPSGDFQRVAWHRLGPSAVMRRPRPASWNGAWKEYWPGRKTNDLYRIGGADKEAVKISAITNIGRQTVTDVRFGEGMLRFRLIFDGKTIDYELKIDDSNTLCGTIRMPDGKIRSVTWLRVGE